MTQTTEESFVAESVETVEVVNDIGDVIVAADDVEDVRVRVVERSTDGQAGLDDIDVTVSLDGGALRVETSIDGDAHWFTRSSPSTDVTVSVPADDTGPTVESITSELGDVTRLNTRGDTTVRANLGEVTANDVDGYLDLQSNLGRVLSSGSTGPRRAHSDLGEVKVEVWDVDSTLSLANVESSEGRLAGQFNGGGPRLHVFSDLGDVALRALQRE
ncbi:MAG: hypothetical protein V5A44_05500 [Haloarculaceae archaeon]